MILTGNKDILTGNLELNIFDKIIDTYSCSYDILDVKGEYK